MKVVFRSQGQGSGTAFIKLTFYNLFVILFVCIFLFIHMHAFLCTGTQEGQSEASDHLDMIKQL